MDLGFRRAEPEDIPTLLEFMQEYYEFDHLVFDPQTARGAIDGLMRDETKGCIWLIHCDGKDIGYTVLSFICTLEFHGDAAFLDELYIIEGYRRRGIGERTVEFLEGICRKRGIDALRLEVERSNTNAHALYKKLGFVSHDRFIMTRWLEANPLNRQGNKK